MQLELFKACENEDLDQVKQLVENGADLEVKNENGQTPLFIAVNLSPKRFCTVSLSRYLETKKARVAPMVEANEIRTKPQASPKRPPPARVIITAPGRDNAVTRTYREKKTKLAIRGALSRSSISWA